MENFSLELRILMERKMKLLIVSAVYVLTVLIRNLPSIIMALSILIETLFKQRRK